jgi:hypothetical protein
MPVLIECFSVITRKDRIESSYPGGVEGFLRDCPNSTACADDHLVRVGFMDPDDLRGFMYQLMNSGLQYLDADGRAKDIVVVDQLKGPTTPCDWAEVVKVRLAGTEFKACRMAGTNDQTLACPGWWTPEKATKNNLLFVPNKELPARMEFIREENGLMVCRDRVTGKIMYSPTNAPTNSPAIPPAGPNSGKASGGMWQAFLSFFRRR